MGHHVTSETSDYFVGYCDLPGCTEAPCLSCVRAQEQYERDSKLRGGLIKAYYQHHGKWPQSAFIDALVEAINNLR